jgi:hypothetical protein
MYTSVFRPDDVIARLVRHEYHFSSSQGDIKHRGQTPAPSRGNIPYRTSCDHVTKRTQSTPVSFCIPPQPTERTSHSLPREHPTANHTTAHSPQVASHNIPLHPPSPLSGSQPVAPVCGPRSQNHQPAFEKATTKSNSKPTHYKCLSQN